VIQEFGCLLLLISTCCWVLFAGLVRIVRVQFFFSGGHCRSWCFLWSHFPSRNPGTDCDASVASKIARAAIHMFAQTQTHAWLPVDSGFSTFAIFLRLRRSTRITQTHTDHADTHGSRRRTRITQTHTDHADAHGSRRHTDHADAHADTHGSRRLTHTQTHTDHAVTQGSRRPHTHTHTDHADRTHGSRRHTRITHTHTDHADAHGSRTHTDHADAVRTHGCRHPS